MDFKEVAAEIEHTLASWTPAKLRKHLLPSIQEQMFVAGVGIPPKQSVPAHINQSFVYQKLVYFVQNMKKGENEVQYLLHAYQALELLSFDGENGAEEEDDAAREEDDAAREEEEVPAKAKKQNGYINFCNVKKPEITEALRAAGKAPDMVEIAKAAAVAWNKLSYEEKQMYRDIDIANAQVFTAEEREQLKQTIIDGMTNDKARQPFKKSAGKIVWASVTRRMKAPASRTSAAGRVRAMEDVDLQDHPICETTRETFELTNELVADTKPTPKDVRVAKTIKQGACEFECMDIVITKNNVSSKVAAGDLLWEPWICQMPEVLDRVFQTTTGQKTKIMKLIVFKMKAEDDFKLQIFYPSWLSHIVDPVVNGIFDALRELLPCCAASYADQRGTGGPTDNYMMGAVDCIQQDMHEHSFKCVRDEEKDAMAAELDQAMDAKFPNIRSAQTVVLKTGNKEMAARNAGAATAAGTAARAAASAPRPHKKQKSSS